MNEQTVISRNGEFLEAMVDRELVALDVDGGTCFGFNPTGTRIWQLLETPRTIGELRDCLLEQFEVEPDECERELLLFLGAIETDGLITRSERPLDEPD